MDKSLYLEKNISQQPAIQLRWLNRYAFAGVENEFSAANIERAMEDLDEPLTDGLVRTSE